jgi:tetratricopeptide (TPR) repeat protein
MTTQNPRREQAARCVEEAIRQHESGALPEAIASLRQAVLLYAAADNAEAEEETAESRMTRRARADACQRCGDYLTEAEEHPEAATVYQEAADLYGRLDGAESEREAHACACKILAGVAALSARPNDRLYLLIAHHERQQRQLALEPGTEQAQAECAVRIARVFDRRERPHEALPRFREALALYARAPQEPEVLLACAECQHRIATLLYYVFNDFSEAAASYRRAIALYTDHEPFAFGEQPSRALCARMLEEVEHRLRSARYLPRPVEE